MYDEIIYAVLTDVAKRLLDDGITDIKILQYTNLTQEQLDTIKGSIEKEKREAEEYALFIENLESLVRDLIFKDVKDNAFSDKVKAYCNSKGKIIPVAQLKEMVKEAYKEKELADK